jgi:hypothetical protein
MGHYSQAYAIYNSMFTHDNYQSYWFVLPYGAWSSVKNGTAPAFETFLNNYRTTNGETSYYHLAQAYLKGGSKKYAESIAHLKAAQYNLSLPNDVESRPLFIWYQVVETCEWLYKDTGYDGYRDLLLTFTKLCQSICPTYAWAYAAEAKYTTSETDRTRALGITLYLDKRSDRISKISDREKKKALKWLENNNPFLRARTNSNKSDI